MGAAWTYRCAAKHLADSGWAGFGFRTYLTGGAETDLVAHACDMANLPWVPSRHGPRPDRGCPSATPAAPATVAVL